MKKIMSFLIVICTIFVCSCSSQKVSITPIEDSVATMTIVSFDGESESVMGLMNLGHAFIAIENNSEEDILVGKYNLKSGRVVTIGTWSILEHFGVWYNVESNYIEYCDKYNGRVSLSKQINKDDLEKITTFINDNDKWNIFRNCSYFAVNLWNSVAKSGESFNVGRTPSAIAKSIKLSDGYNQNQTFAVSSSMGYFDGSNYVEFKLEGEHYARV